MPLKKKPVHRMIANRASGKIKAARAKAGQKSFSIKKGVSLSTVKMERIKRSNENYRKMNNESDYHSKTGKSGYKK